MEIVWNAERYTKLIQAGIQSLGKQFKGRMAVLSGDTDWHSLAAGVRKLDPYTYTMEGLRQRLLGLIELRLGTTAPRA